VRYIDPDGETLFVPLIILGIIAVSTLHSSKLMPPPKADISRTMDILSNKNYGAPKNDMQRLMNKNSRNSESKKSILIGNNILSAVGASLPTNGLTPNDYDDGRSGMRKDAMTKLGFLGDVAGRARNSDGYFAGDIIFEAYKTDGVVTNWAIKETYTLADGSKGYVEYKEDEAVKYINEKYIYLKEVGLLNEINKAIDF